MPRRKEHSVPGRILHVLARGARAQPIFLAAEDYRLFLYLLEDLLGEHGHWVLAYCLMPNHVHLLIECGAEPLPRFMQRLLARYALRFNRKHDQAGHVFQGRHATVPCRDDGHFLELLRYIHLNPVRAGLCARAEEHPWSSAADYLGRRGIVPVLTSRALRLVADSETEGAALMRELLGAAAPASGTRPSNRNGPGPSGPAPAQRQPQPQRPPFGVLASLVAADLSIAPGALWARDRSPAAVRARRVLARLAVDVFGYSQKEVARRLDRSRGAVSGWLAGEPSAGERGTLSRCAGLLATREPLRGAVPAGRALPLPFRDAAIKDGATADRRSSN